MSCATSLFFFGIETKTAAGINALKKNYSLTSFLLIFFFKLKSSEVNSKSCPANSIYYTQI